MECQPTNAPGLQTAQSADLAALLCGCPSSLQSPPPPSTALLPIAHLDNAWQGRHVGNLFDRRQKATMLQEQA